MRPRRFKVPGAVREGSGGKGLVRPAGQLHVDSVVKMFGSGLRSIN